jgi:Zn-dependent peptidase ImmA (M78 family)
MRIPDSVKIGPRVFRVEQPQNVVDGADNLWGKCEHSAGVIYVAARLSQDQQAVTLLHEVIHALDHQYDLNLKESQVRRLSYALMSFLKDNSFLG